MTLRVPVQALYILRTLRQAQFEACIVGGAVRDLLLAVETATDFDFTTNATPEQIAALFTDSFYENTFGTVSVTYNTVMEQLQLPLPVTTVSEDYAASGKIIDVAQATKLHESLHSADAAAQTITTHYPNYEITTFRSDGIYSDFRRPNTVTWGKTLAEDLARRDFTINALALKISDHFLETTLAVLPPAQQIINIPISEYEVIDHHQGVVDLQAKTIRTVGDPHTRFQEDALRLLRTVRFSVQLNMSIDETTFGALTTHAKLLEYVSGERIRDEFLKILKSSFPAEGVELLDNTGLLTYIMPELQQGKGVKQGGHHTTDVWTHSLDALRECPSSDPIVRLATLLHDIGKPHTQAFTPTTITFYNHELVGARMARHIGYRLRLSKKDVDRLFTLVRHHMFHYQPHNTDAAIRRFMRRVGLENIDDILDLREADRLGSGARKTSWRLEEMKQRMIEQLHQPMAIKDLAINGHDLMTEFKLEPGPQLGKILHHLFEIVLDEPELNTKEKMLEKAREIMTK